MARSLLILHEPASAIPQRAAIDKQWQAVSVIYGNIYSI